MLGEPRGLFRVGFDKMSATNRITLCPALVLIDVMRFLLISSSPLDLALYHTVLPCLRRPSLFGWVITWP